MYARVKRWRDRKSAPLTGIVVEQSICGGAPSSLSSIIQFEFKISVNANIGEAEEEAETGGSIGIVMPAWLDHDKTIATLSK